MGQCYTYFVSTLPHNQTKLYIEFHYDDLLLSHRNELKRSIPSSHSSAMYASRAHSSPSFLSLTISIWLTSEVQWNSKTNFRLLNSHLQIPLPTNSQGISLSNSHAFSFLCMLCHSCAMDLLFDSFDFVLRRGEKKGRGGGGFVMMVTSSPLHPIWSILYFVTDAELTLLYSLFIWYCVVCVWYGCCWSFISSPFLCPLDISIVCIGMPII